MSFDYGLSQLTTAFLVGATAVLHNYLLAADALRVLARERITGLAAVPPLWLQLAALPWPAAVNEHLRYFTNSGGAMPTATLAALRERAPAAQPFLMYGLTEAFRSTYLPPEEIDRRPTSMGKAIPNAEILVVREDGTPCADNEPGELVHRGALVSLGYWNDPARTAERFKPLPRRSPGIVPPGAGGLVGRHRQARRGRLPLFRRPARRDDQVLRLPDQPDRDRGGGLPHRAGRRSRRHGRRASDARPGDRAGRAARGRAASATTDALLAACREYLPGFMMPTRVDWLDRELPRNANGKIDRKLLAPQRSRQMFSPEHHRHRLMATIDVPPPRRNRGLRRRRRRARRRRRSAHPPRRTRRPTPFYAYSRAAISRRVADTAPGAAGCRATALCDEGEPDAGGGRPSGRHSPTASTSHRPRRCTSR